MDQEEIKINFDNKQLETDIENEFKNDFSDNNLLFNYQRVALGKTYISGASQYPPRLSRYHTAGAYNPTTNTCTNLIVVDNYVQPQSINNIVFHDVPNLLIDTESQISHIMGDTGIEIRKQKDERDNIGIITSIEQITFTDHILHQDYDEKKDVIIESKLRKWHVTVPMAMEDGTIKQIRMFADPGANSACVRTAWAAQWFRSMILRNSKYATLATPGGKIHPKYQLQVAFPCKNGVTLRAKMFLVDDLPVDILADISLRMKYLQYFVMKQKKIWILNCLIMVKNIEYVNHHHRIGFNSTHNAKQSSVKLVLLSMLHSHHLCMIIYWLTILRFIIIQ